MSTDELAQAVVDRRLVRLRVASLRRLAEAVLAKQASKPSKDKKAKKAKKTNKSGGKKSKLAKIPGQAL